MRNKLKNAAALLASVFLTATLIGCAAEKPSDNNSGKLSIVCTNFSEYDWTREIIGDTDSADIRYLLESGMDIKTLSRLLGHSSIQISLDLYAHVTDQLQAEHMANLRNFLK